MNVPFDPASQPPLFDLSIDEDLHARLEPRAFTALLREQVPVLEYAQWTLVHVGPGVAMSRLPLSVASTNQHFTHQAAMLLLAADYTGAAALASLLVGWPVLGIHPVTTRHSAAGWLVGAEIRFLRPSTGALTASAIVEPDAHARILQRFVDGHAVIEPVMVMLYNGDVCVAEVKATYYVRQTDRLRAVGIATPRVNPLYMLRLTSSAELVAGVRARQRGAGFDDPYAMHMAGEHGLALADRFCERTPQLGSMVAARTRHLDALVKAFTDAGGRQIVNVGVGWCMRAFRLPLPEGTRYVELDFPTTLTERARRIGEVDAPEQAGVERIAVPIDVRSMPVDHTVADHIDPREPVLVIWEGVSMYLLDAEVRAVLDGIRSLLRHPASRLWFDVVDDALVRVPQGCAPEVRSFLRGMQLLGEPFTFGVGDVPAFIDGVGLRCIESVGADALLGDTDPVHAVYRFCIAGGALDG